MKNWGLNICREFASGKASRSPQPDNGEGIGPSTNRRRFHTTNIASADYLIPFRKKGLILGRDASNGLLKYAGERRFHQNCIVSRRGTAIKSKTDSRMDMAYYASCFGMIFALAVCCRIWKAKTQKTNDINTRYSST